MSTGEPLIVLSAKVMIAKPVATGTRITVELTLGKLAAGEIIERILDAHPRLMCEAVLTAITFVEEASCQRSQQRPCLMKQHGEQQQNVPGKQSPIF
ncbi:MAG: DUF433 domain-containing protein [Blastocatellia bacterium]|nr:DUF433 domain-containing protein [Blastocatellia bacterium]